LQKCFYKEKERTYLPCCMWSHKIYPFLRSREAGGTRKEVNWLSSCCGNGPQRAKCRLHARQAHQNWFVNFKISSKLSSWCTKVQKCEDVVQNDYKKNGSWKSSSSWNIFLEGVHKSTCCNQCLKTRMMSLFKRFINKNWSTFMNLFVSHSKNRFINLCLFANRFSSNSCCSRDHAQTTSCHDVCQERKLQLLMNNILLQNKKPLFAMSILINTTQTHQLWMKGWVCCTGQCHRHMFWRENGQQWCSATNTTTKQHPSWKSFSYKIITCCC